MSAASAVSTFDVGGVLVDRPFKIRRLGTFGYNCVNTAATLAFYRDTLGLRLSDISRPLDAQPEKRSGLGDDDGQLYFLRYGTEHHQFVLTSQRLWDLLAEDAGGSGRSVNRVTWQVGSLAEVVNGAEWTRAVAILKEY
jgi:catechol 2,3-dioxygenase-like lactoylglutathione lyase family enzyme